MKRSKINRAISEALELFQEKGIRLPAWGYWTAHNWKDAGDEASEIREHQLGWNVTDFGSGDFNRTGLLMFVVRNGHLDEHHKPMTTKTYAEKYMVVRPGQITPWHFHWVKTEDLVNRSGGRLQVELAWPAENELCLSDEERDMTIKIDGLSQKLPDDGKILLLPGQSVELSPRMCHKFYGYALDDSVIAGEISSLNDDGTDNCFLGKNVDRTAIEEDEPAKYILSSEYTQLCRR